MAKLYFVVVRQWHWWLCWPPENFQWLYFSKIIKLVLNLNWLTRFYIFLGSSGFKEEGRALKDVALDGVALPSIVASDCPQWPESSQLPLSSSQLTGGSAMVNWMAGKTDMFRKGGFKRSKENWYEQNVRRTLYAWYDLREKYQVYELWCFG